MVGASALVQAARVVGQKAVASPQARHQNNLQNVQGRKHLGFEIMIERCPLRSLIRLRFVTLETAPEF